MDIKKYVENQNKNWQKNLPQTIKNYSDNELKVQIKMNKQSIREKLYCKICTPKKVNDLLSMLEKEAELRNLTEV